MALAQQVANPSDNRDARYSLAGLQKLSDGTYTDGVYKYDDSGRGINRPNSSVSGLPSASSSEAYNVYTGQTGGGGGGGGGGGSDVFGNPYFQQYQSILNAAKAADLADTNGQIQNLLVQFGMVPGSFQDKYGAINDTIRNLIKQNTESGISQYARLLEGKKDTQHDTIAGLASRGLLRSGAKGYQLRRNTLNFDRTLSDATNAVLGNVNQLQSGYANRELQRQQSLAQRLSSLFQNYVPSGGGGGYNPPPPPTPPPPAPTYNAPGFQTQYGVGQTQPSGYQIPTGGGFYTNQQTGDLTAKWKKLA